MTTASSSDLQAAPAATAIPARPTRLACPYRSATTIEFAGCCAGVFRKNVTSFLITGLFNPFVMLVTSDNQISNKPFTAYKRHPYPPMFIAANLALNCGTSKWH